MKLDTLHYYSYKTMQIYTEHNLNPLDDWCITSICQSKTQKCFNILKFSLKNMIKENSKATNQHLFQEQWQQVLLYSGESNTHQHFLVAHWIRKPETYQ
jgi:hypothetical protein